MVTYTIDELPELAAVLGKARTDRIRYHQQGTGRRQSAAANIKNTVRLDMVDLQETDDTDQVMEYLISAARLDAGVNGMPLSASRLSVMLQCLPIINTKETMLMMHIGPRQAQRYVRAAKFALPLLIKFFANRKARRKEKDNG